MKKDLPAYLNVAFKGALAGNQLAEESGDLRMLELNAA
jgi:hypothetical protein